MENTPQHNTHKLVRTLGWIVGKTLVLTSKMLVITLKVGIQFIISRLTTASRPAQLPARRDAKMSNY